MFYTITGLAPEWRRTTSLLERTNRELRRTFRQAVTFGSVKGAEVALSLHVRRLHARWRGDTWWDASQQVFFDLWNLHPERRIHYRVFALLDPCSVHVI
ncbi:MAG TPA: hypothetical protein VGF67_23785 [Ktedonobacteraceae bacterium]